MDAPAAPQKQNKANENAIGTIPIDPQNDLLTGAAPPNSPSTVHTATEIRFLLSDQQ